MKRWPAGLLITPALLACTVTAPSPIGQFGKLHLSDTPMYPFSEGGKTGFTDRSGRVVVQPRFFGYGVERDYFEGVLVHEQELLDTRGRPIRHGGWILAGDRSAEGFIRIGLPNGKVTHLNWKRKSVLPGQFEAVLDFADGLAAVKQGGKWGFIDRTGRVIIAPRFLQAGGFSNGLARVIENGPCWIDPGACQPKVVIGASEEWYLEAARHPERPIDPGEPEYREGVKLSWSRSSPGVWFADETGNKLFNRTFARATPFRHGLALVSEGRENHYIDHAGRTVFSFPSLGVLPPALEKIFRQR